jgi:hypothetical protein
MVSRYESLIPWLPTHTFLLTPTRLEPYGQNVNWRGVARAKSPGSHGDESERMKVGFSTSL